ncbi:MAG: hypothetical protein WA709_07515 [Stellaceae bacterium]
MQEIEGENLGIRERIKHILATAATAENRNPEPNVTFIAFPLGEW